MRIPCEYEAVNRALTATAFHKQLLRSQRKSQNLMRIMMTLYVSHLQSESEVSAARSRIKDLLERDGKTKTGHLLLWNKEYI